jgi:nucleotide-binding universal stress UspA family protein
LYQKILVPLDGSALSEQVVPFVVALAQSLKSAVVLAHVVDTSALEDSSQMWVEMPSIKQFVDEETARASSYLNTLKQRVEAAGLQVSTQMEVGTPAKAIISLAASSKADLVAMSTHGRSGVARWMIGSVADRVIHETGLPLLLYRPEEGAKASPAIKNIIVPLDGSQLAEQTLPTVEALAKAVNAQVTLFRAISTYTFAFAEPYPFGGAEASVEVLEAIEQEAEDYLNTQAQALRSKGLTVQTKKVLGEPANQLVELAHATADSLTVISTHGRSGVARTLLGSVADRVVRSSGRPVLLLRSKA